MMKKAFAALGLAALVFAGCSNGSTGTDGETTNSASVNSDQGEITATVTKKDGKITAVSIDQVDSKTGKGKKELGADYGMKAASPIEKEWNEQIEYLENYIVEHGADAVKLNEDGTAADEDVKSGATINLKDIMDAVNKAAAK